MVDAITGALLPPGFVSPYAGITPEGLLGNASTPLSTFLAYTALTDSDGAISEICFQAPTFMYPLVQNETLRSSIDSSTYNSWGRKNYMSAIDFGSVSGSSVTFDVFYNYSLTSGSDLPIFINLVSNALWRYIRSQAGLSDSSDSYMLNPGVKNMPTGVVDNTFDIVSLGCPNLYIYVFMLLLPVTMESLVIEKESRLRETMRMMGLKTHVYFISMYLWNYFLYVCLAVLAAVIGLILGFAFWLHNTFLSWFILFFLWGHTLIALAWLISIFITSARTAVVVGYAIILALGILCTNLIRDIVLNEFTPSATLFGISVIPPLAFFRGLTIINNQISWKGPGMPLSGIGSTGLWQIYVFLIVEWLVLITLAIYFELVLPIGPGAKKDPLFFLPRRFWCFKSDESKATEHELADLEEDSDKPDDVLAEERRALSDPNLAVKSLGLHKVYTRGGKSKVAVRRLTMGIRNGECFGFLGPNGAGKSTTISMLCGYLRPTSGDATINGLSIKEDMDEIHLQMGVCPQDDALWDTLTGPEHLEFYGRLKNLSGSELKEQINFWLEQVNLASKKTRQKASMEYSGGMKRRLSVACAMIGYPSVVLMDEPTTGLDPASRIALWEVVRKFKSQCAMMLTTHSMDEAEALCDRLGIFVAGRLKTIGHASELKERYGRFYKIQVTTNLSKDEHLNADQQIFDLLKKLSPNTRLLNSLAGTNNFEAPSADIELADLFDTLEAHKKELGIQHWGVSNTTLEEVFLKVTQDEVQDEALKFAKKKKAPRTGCCAGCCGGGHNVTEAEVAALDPEHGVEMQEHQQEPQDGDVGFLSEPSSSARRLAPTVNELAPDNDSDDDDDESDEDSDMYLENTTTSDSSDSQA